MQRVNPQMVIYEPQAIGKKKGYVKSNEKSVNEMGSFNHYETNVVIEPGKLMFLKGNPFLYNSETAPYKINSIEDYIIKANKEEIEFGEVIRNSRFKPRQRKRIIKDAFKNWNKDYSKMKSTTFTESDKLIDVIGEVKYLNYSIRMKLLSFALFFLMLFMVGTDSYIWDTLSKNEFGYYINQTLQTMYQNYSWIKIVANIDIYIIMALIFFLTIYNYISKDFRRSYRLSQEYLKDSEKTITKEYKKKFKKSRKYYLSLINNKKQPYYAPFDISNVEEGEVNITTFNTICKVTVDRAYKYKKKRPYILFGKNVLMYLSIGGTFIIVIFFLYNVIKSIF